MRSEETKAGKRWALWLPREADIFDIRVRNPLRFTKIAEAGVAVDIVRSEKGARTQEGPCGFELEFHRVVRMFTIPEEEIYMAKLRKERG